MFLYLMKRCFFVCLLFFFSFSVNSGKYPYPEEAADFALDVLQLLVDQGECRNIGDCRSKELVFKGGRDSELINISIYKSNSLKKTTIKKVIKLCSDTYYSRNMRLTVSLKIYRETMWEQTKWFSGVAPFIELTLKGN